MSEDADGGHGGLVGVVERFHQTMADGWAYSRCYQSEAERCSALEAWLRRYNQHRPHTACENRPPITRLTNLPDQYTKYRLGRLPQYSCLLS